MERNELVQILLEVEKKAHHGFTALSYGVMFPGGNSPYPGSEMYDIVVRLLVEDLRKMSFEVEIGKHEDGQVFLHVSWDMDNEEDKDYYDDILEEYIQMKKDPDNMDLEYENIKFSMDQDISKSSDCVDHE